MAAITLLVLLAPPWLGLSSAIFTYHGKCYGFTDGSWSCTWLEYAADQVFWAAFLDIPLSMYLLPSWLVTLALWIYRRRAAAPDRLPFPLIALIPVGGYFIGFGLISILPIFIRFFYSYYP